VAWTLNNLTDFLLKTGHYRDAVAAGQEALTLYRALAAEEPAAHQEQLAWTLWDLGLALEQAGNLTEALSDKAESVGIYKKLASRDLDLYQEKYRQYRGQLQRQYSQIGMNRKAILLDIDNPADGH
jgi:tetratricopeptide (TPR) repeat protein